ncbi:MAG: sulfite exporter TauE/SafE family protein [Desulforhopalus sp.]
MDEIFSLFLLGLTYGVTVCSFSCLPYFGPYLIGTGTGFKDGVVASCAFAGGKTCTYSALAGAAALFGGALTITPIHSVIMGVTVIAVAVSIPFVAQNGCRKRSQVQGKRFSMFVLGILSSLIPCPPLAAVFLLAARQSDVVTGMAYGCSFGMGLVVSPMLLAGGTLALISQQIRQEIIAFAPYMQKIAMGVMIFIGVRMMVS